MTTFAIGGETVVRRLGFGAMRLVDDVTSARASGVTLSPALFVNDERYEDVLEPEAVSAALE